jgi:protein-disulfide isomerase
MRLILMNRIVLAAALLLALPSAVPALAQTTFRDTSMLRAPAGSKVAIFEFEDLECPACAHAFPIVHEAVEHYKIPLLRHDFPLRMHIWSFDAAVNARYMQDKISPQFAEDYRRAVFANQTSIASKDDLNAFTLGERVGLTQTPTIFIVTQKGYVQVNDVTQLYSMLDTAIAEAGSATTAKAKTTAHK